MSLRKQYVIIKKLEALYRTDKSIASSLEMIASGERSPFIKSSFKKIAEEVKNGSSLAAALDKHYVVDDVYCRLIKVGEQSGKLDVVLQQIITLLDNLIIVRRKVIAASLYPLGLIGAFTGVFVVIMTVIVPLLINFFKKFDMEPPGVILFMDTIVNPFSCCCALPLVLFILAAGIYIYLNIDAISMFRGFLFIWVPGFGRLDKLKNIYTYAFTLKICYEAGLTLYEAAELAAENVSNAYMSDRFYAVYDRLKSGSDLATAVNSVSYFNYEMIDLLKVGEETGKIDETLAEIIKIIDEKIRTTVAIMMAMIKPLGLIMGVIFLIGIFVLIGILLFSVLVKVKSALPV